MIKILNIFDIPKKQNGNEYIKELLNIEGARVEVITSFAPSPEGFWYDQTEYEFVSVLKGKAVLNIEGDLVKLKKGDYVTLLPHQKHRVQSVPLKCVWLCIYYERAAKI